MTRKNIQKQKGFTIIELLIVIVILGILASFFLVSFRTWQYRAKLSRTEGELLQIRLKIDVARYAGDQVLGEVTGSWCSDCPCRDVPDLIQLSSSHACITNWENVASKIGFPAGTRDPWGDVYLVDENELEGGNCNLDTLKSAGPDRKMGGGDDIIAEIPYHSEKCAW